MSERGFGGRYMRPASGRWNSCGWRALIYAIAANMGFAARYWRSDGPRYAGRTDCRMTHDDRVGLQFVTGGRLSFGIAPAITSQGLTARERGGPPLRIYTARDALARFTFRRDQSTTVSWHASPAAQRAASRFRLQADSERSAAARSPLVRSASGCHTHFAVSRPSICRRGVPTQFCSSLLS